MFHLDLVIKRKQECLIRKDIHIHKILHLSQDKFLKSIVSMKKGKGIIDYIMNQLYDLEA